MKQIFPLAIVVWLLVGQAWCQALSQPNFIIIFTDDQGYGDLGCFGSPNIETPNIDRMAAEGIRFTSFYAAPCCGPSIRACRSVKTRTRAMSRLRSEPK